jgi:hypothetical protein
MVVTNMFVVTNKLQDKVVISDMHIRFNAEKGFVVTNKFA